jgi:crossover junction endodeoxyribonuclease RuvC
MGTGKQRELDGATLAAWLREHRPVKAFIEYAAARPGQGVNSMFRYGGMSWGLKAGLAAFGVPCIEVTAATWKRAAGIALQGTLAADGVAALAGPSQAPRSQA